MVTILLCVFSAAWVTEERAFQWLISGPAAPVAAREVGVLQPDWIKPDAVVIDAGINRITLADGQSRITGEVAEGAMTRNAAFTPAPPPRRGRPPDRRLPSVQTFGAARIAQAGDAHAA